MSNPSAGPVPRELEEVLHEESEEELPEDMYVVLGNGELVPFDHYAQSQGEMWEAEFQERSVMEQEVIVVEGEEEDMEQESYVEESGEAEDKCCKNAKRESRNGRGAARGGGRVSKPSCARSLSFPTSAIGNVEDVKPTPGQSGQRSRPNSLKEQMKAAKAKTSPKEHLMELRHKKQVGNFRMPDSPSPKKGKAKNRKEDTRVWIPCPLLPGVPAVPPPRVLQPWEIKRSRDIIKKEKVDVIKGTPPKTAPESLMDITDATDKMSPGSSTAKSKTVVSPAKTTPRKKSRKIQISPSTEILQTTELPQNPVSAEIEIREFKPSSTTSTTAPGSRESINELDVDVNPDFLEPGEGSDVEQEDLADITLKPSNVDDCFPDPSLAEALQSIDAEADSALRTAIGPDQDMLHFDWQSEPENFEGVRETFTVPSTGPTFENAELTPLAIFLKIWDANIIAHIVRETNRYAGEILMHNQKANSRITRWKDVTDDEINKFFAIIMLQSLVINYVEREYWYPRLEELQIGNFRAIMPYNRFLMIKRCLHFVDNASLPEHPNRLDKIMPIIEHLNKKFSSLYVLEQNVAIDESLLLWKGRLSFSQKIATKKARVGIKSYELCESRTGYLWGMEVYSGKGHVHVAQSGAQQPVEEHGARVESQRATSQIVLTLMRPLFNRGHTLVMDNFYNAPLLSRILKVKHKTDSMGTLRLNREFVPEGLRKKTKADMKAGEVAFSSTKDLNVVVWMDKNMVAMISTFHQIKVGGIEKYGYYRFKPQVILDYNLSMGGIDHKDQMLHAYPVERVRNTIWYKKLFRRLVNVSIHNSFVMFNHNRSQVLGNREFRLQLAKELLQMYRPLALPRPLPEPEPSQKHLPAKNERKQRCKMCYAAKVRRTTVWRCSTCAVNLCIEGCYTAYHK